MDTTNAHDFENIYQELEIDMGSLGCIMVDVDTTKIPPFLNTDNLAPNNNHSATSGEAHVTLLFGLLKSGVTWKKYVDQVLQGVSIENVLVTSVGFFESPDPNNKNYCIIANIAISPEIQLAHDRLALLPHVDTFYPYHPHMTLCYLKYDEKIRDNVVEYYNAMISGKTFATLGINYGDAPTQVGKSLTAFCVSCRSSKPLNNPESHQTKNGRSMLSAKCPDCNTSIHRFA
jgi:hypothetical protein